MNPGDRVNTKCSGCNADILLIETINHRRMPCDPMLCKADGKRQLLFPDGTTGRTHALYKYGHESHFATCPKAGNFRRKKR